VGISWEKNSYWKFVNGSEEINLIGEKRAVILEDRKRFKAHNDNILKENKL
jgi:hypothetical protein